MTPAEEAEAIEIELELRKRNSSAEPKSEVDNPNKEQPPSDPEDIKKKWAESTPSQRAQMLVKRFFGIGQPSQFVKTNKEALSSAADMALEASGPAIGQTLGAMTGPWSPVAVPVLGAIGGMIGDAAAQMRGDKPFKIGQMLGSGVSGAVPGGNLAGAGAKQIAKEGAKIAAGNVAATMVESEIDEGKQSPARLAAAAGLGVLGAGVAAKLSKSASLTESQLMNADRDAALSVLKNEGVVVPPHEVEKGMDLVSSIGGKAALQQEASRRNQPIWQRLAREEIGLTREPLPIRIEDLDRLRTQYGEPYRQIERMAEDARVELNDRLSALSKEPDHHTAAIMFDAPDTQAAMQVLHVLASADVNGLKNARLAAQRAYDSKAINPNWHDEWVKMTAIADDLEKKIEDAALTVGDDSLLNRLRNSRKKIAQTYSVQESLNPTTGAVDPIALGRQKADRPKVLSGNLEKIADFALAFNREAVEANRVGNPGVNNLGTTAAMSTAARGDVPGLIGAAVHATAGRAVRPVLLSDFIQRGVLKPDEHANFSAALARFVAEQARKKRATESDDSR